MERAEQGASEMNGEAWTKPVTMVGEMDGGRERLARGAVAKMY